MCNISFKWASQRLGLFVLFWVRFCLERSSDICVWAALYQAVMENMNITMLVLYSVSNAASLSSSPSVGTFQQPYMLWMESSVSCAWIPAACKLLYSSNVRLRQIITFFLVCQNLYDKGGKDYLMSSLVQARWVMGYTEWRSLQISQI